MSPAHRRAALLLALAYGCKFDKIKLRDPAQLDAMISPMDAALDTPMPPVDVPSMTDIRDVRDVPVVRDVPTRPPRVGACQTHPFTELTLQPSNNFGGTLVINGNTAMDMPMASTFTRPVFGTRCSDNPGPMMAPERVFKYVVQRGPRLVATTNGAPCSGTFDTVLYAINSCDMAISGANVLDCCDDDVQICDMCPASTTCNTHLSTVEMGPLVAGDVVYLVVDGYETSAGTFRLSVTENGARPVAPPTPALPNHCTCPALTMNNSRLVDGFPNAALDHGTVLRMPNDTISGLRSVNLRTITGVAGQFRMGANNLAGTGSCLSASAIVDLLIENTVVASFQLSGVQESGAMVQVVYSSFAPVMVQNQTMVSLSYRLRGFEPSSCAGSFEIDQSNAVGTNQLTLYGTP